MSWWRQRNSPASLLLSVGLLLSLGILLSSCGSTKTADALPQGSCPAPQIAEWSDEVWEALAQELEIGEPETEWEQSELRFRLHVILPSIGTEGQVSLWDLFPETFSALQEHIVLREQILGCSKTAV